MKTIAKALLVSNDLHGVWRDLSTLRHAPQRSFRRFRCPLYKKTYTEPHRKTLDRMYISEDKALPWASTPDRGKQHPLNNAHHRAWIRNTIMKMLVLAGEKCEKVMGRLIVNVPAKDVECDEIWAFIQKKEGHKKASEANDETIGDQYCFCGHRKRNSRKLVLNFALGRRNQQTTDVFVEGLRAATSRQHFQITTDGFAPYRSAIVNTLEDRCDFAQLIKVYRAPSEGEGRYSPAEVASTEVVPVLGNPDPERICTSIVERQNLTIRMQMRRLTRLTNAFSKKWDNLWAAYCLHFAYYNFCRIHSSIQVTPAMETGITDHVWELAELLA